VEAPLLKVARLATYFHTSGGIARAVDGVDLEVGHGEILGIVGESGSGKSVAALSIMGLVRPPGKVQAGSSVVFGGTEVLSMSARELRAFRSTEVAMIGQRPMSSLNPIKRIGAQATEAMRIHLGLSRGDAREKFVELMQSVGIDHADRRFAGYPFELSGGTAQRVLIAMALSCDPKLLIADEPTTALDVTIQAEILALIARLRSSRGMSVLFITHDLGVVAQLADRVAVMYGGRVVESGSVTEVLTAPAHPYTKALLRCTPRLGMHYQTPLEVIPGRVPDATAWPTGCRFASRCASAMPKCTENDPPTFIVDDRHEATCWLWEDRPKKFQDQ
jgi:oligopeptide/dipeptide ABC transporter ATP-binding protein